MPLSTLDVSAAVLGSMLGKKNQPEEPVYNLM